MTRPPLQILIIAHDSSRAAILEEDLRDSGDVVVHSLRDVSRLVQRIEAIDPDVILIDLEAADRKTLDEYVAASSRARRPVVVFVDAADSAMIEAAVGAGVASFVVDGLKKGRIKPIVDVAVMRHRTTSRLEAELVEAKLALEERKLVERAKAILMKETRVSEEEAYAMLRRTAMNQHRKIADLARALISASQLIGRADREE